jgi:hypothetical protein
MPELARPTAHLTRPAPSLRREETTATRRADVPCESGTAPEMFENQLNTLRESFSALSRESLFERQGNSPALPPTQPTGILGLKAEDDQR